MTKAEIHKILVKTYNRLEKYGWIFQGWCTLAKPNASCLVGTIGLVIEGNYTCSDPEYHPANFRFLENDSVDEVCRILDLPDFIKNVSYYLERDNITHLVSYFNDTHDYTAVMSVLKKAIQRTAPDPEDPIVELKEKELV